MQPTKFLNRNNVGDVANSVAQIVTPSSTSHHMTSPQTLTKFLFKVPNAVSLNLNVSNISFKDRNGITTNLDAIATKKASQRSVFGAETSDQKTFSPNDTNHNVLKITTNLK